MSETHVRNLQRIEEGQAKAGRNLAETVPKETIIGMITANLNELPLARFMQSLLVHKVERIFNCLEAREKGIDDGKAYDAAYATLVQLIRFMQSTSADQWNPELFAFYCGEDDT